MQTNTLFKTDIYKLSVDKHDEIKRFLTENVERAYLDQGPNCNFCNVYSDYFAGALHINWEDLYPKYENTITKFLNDFGFDENLNWNVSIRSWYNVTGQGGWGEIHNHLTSPMTTQICAVHYVKYNPKVHSPTIFYNPASDGIRSTQPVSVDSKLPKLWPKETVQLDVQEGDMIFFPPYLNHSIPIQNTDETRITTAFNIAITEY
jgi:uncharacterized protein (TIGR02466 family)